MRFVDLHVHSTASDGEIPPADVVHCAAKAGLVAVALTDHDTLDGIPQAAAASAEVGVRVIAGCEFSVAAGWGEMHLLGYFLPSDHPGLNRFLAEQRQKRVERAHLIVQRLNRIKVPADVEGVMSEAGDAAVGRPHVARSLVKMRVVRDANEAFDRFLAEGRPAFVPKDLPTVADVSSLVREVGGVTSAAHLGSRATRAFLTELQQAGVDGAEVVHPAHGDHSVRRIRALAKTLRMLPTGGSDWHGDRTMQGRRGQLGSLQVSEAWLDGLEALHRERVAAAETAT